VLTIAFLVHILNAARCLVFKLWMHVQLCVVLASKSVTRVKASGREAAPVSGVVVGLASVVSD